MRENAVKKSDLFRKLRKIIYSKLHNQLATANERGNQFHEKLNCKKESNRDFLIREKSELERFAKQ